MKSKTIITVIAVSVALLLFSGCASTDTARLDYQNKLSSAYRLLESGNHDLALKNLEQAEKIANTKNIDQTESLRLRVEACLGIGNNVEAFNYAKELLDKNPDDSYANELMGKVLLKDSQYSEAEKHFVAAQQTYKSEADLARISDLLALTRGLSQYQSGNPKLAQRYFREIQNVELQYAVDKAQKDVAL